MSIPLIPIMHELCFPLASIFLKEKSDGVKIIPVIFVREPYFMVCVDIVEDVLQGIIDNRTEIGWIKVVETVQEVANIIVVEVTAKTTQDSGKTTQVSPKTPQGALQDRTKTPNIAPRS